MSDLDSDGSFLTALQTDALTVGTNCASNVTASVQLARIIYVDQALGNDSFAGKSPIRSLGDGPKKTIQSGMQAVGDGGILVLRSGYYPESLDVKGKNVRVRLEGRVVLTGAKNSVRYSAEPGPMEIPGATTNR